MGRQERDLAPERGFPAPCLPARLGRADHDVPDVELAVLVPAQLPYSVLTLRPPDGLTEREDVGRPVFRPIAPIERPHFFVRDEGDSDPRVEWKAVGLHRRADRAADRRQVAWRLAAEGESQVPEALDGGVAAGGRRAMRSSGYGIRS